MYSESENSSVCPACGFPPEAGHASGCVNGPSKADTRLQEEFLAEEAVTDEAKEEFFKLYGKINSMPEDMLQRKIQSFNRPVEARHLFIVRDENGQIIAGAAVEVERGKEAYFRMKVVEDSYRGKGLAAQLTQKRVESATEAGCREAYAVVGGADGSALRAIFKDGFAIRAKNNQEQNSQSPDEFSYRVTRDLTVPRPGNISVAEVKDVKTVESEGDISGDKLLVPWYNQELIDNALSRGYVGKQLFRSKDLTELQGLEDNVLYFERLKL